MKVSVSFHGISQESRPRLHALIEERAHRLEHHFLSSFQPDLVRLESRIEKNAAHHLYRVALRLKLPRAVLATAAENFGLQSALKEAFDELDRRSERHVSRLQREHLWKRTARRLRLEKLKQGTRGSHDREQRRILCELIQPHLDDLHGYIAREILYRQESGDARARMLDAPDILAGTLLRALERAAARPRRIEVRDWLLSLAQQEIADALSQVLDSQSLESSPPGKHEEPTTRDEERYVYWEPDERLKLEDLLPDVGADDPEHAAAERDLRRALVRAIAALPQSWRQAITLTMFEGLTAAQAGALLGRPEAQIEETLRHTRAFLEARAADAGFEYSPEGAQVASIADLGRTPLSPEEREEILTALGA